MGKNVVFLSNSNSKSREQIRKHLGNLGINTEIKYIYNSGYLISKYITTCYPNIKNLYLVGRDGLKEELISSGLNISGGSEDDNKSFSLNDEYDSSINDNFQGVVCGFDDKINYYKLSHACQIIKNTGNFFGTNIDKNVRINKLLFPGSYTFVSALETCSETKAKIIGKPDPFPLKIIKEAFNFNENSKILMVGDNLDTDIQFAYNCGIDSVLLFTGVTDINEYKTKLQKNNETLPTPKFLMEEFRF